MKPLRWLPVLAFLAAARLAHADAALTSSAGTRFPTGIDVAVDVRAQVEMTTMVLRFDPIDAGDYMLTVPSPKLGYVVGVDVDRGEGFVPAPMVGEAPPPALGGSASAGDPQVAAWMGTTPLRADLADLAQGPLTVRVRFQRLLRRYAGEVSFAAGVERTPLRPAEDAGAEVSISVTIATFRPLAVLELTGDGTVVSRTTAGATVTAQAVGSTVAQIRYAEEPAGIDVHFLAHRTPTADPLGGSDGYFLVIIDADAAAPDRPRRLSLVIDESGSMFGEKIAQARDAARAMLDHVGPLDRFNILAFSDDVRGFAAAPVAATADNVNAAREWIKDIDATNGTNLDAGIEAGLGGFGAGEPQRFDAMVLLSDGMATVGEQDDVQIHASSLVYNQSDARVFTFSVGRDADLPLMEALARSHHGRHVHLNEAQAVSEMVERVNELFEDIRSPRLTDLAVEVVAIEPTDVLPEAMTDLFSGGQAILVGRYRTPGPGTVRIDGLETGGPFARDVAVTAPELIEENEIIKYVWATEQVGRLLGDMSRGGDVAALQAEITELGLAYRIQTPFTSFSTGLPPPPGGGGGGSGGGSGGGGGGGGWNGAGAAGPLDLLAALALCVAAARRRRPR